MFFQKVEGPALLEECACRRMWCSSSCRTSCVNWLARIFSWTLLVTRPVLEGFVHRNERKWCSKGNGISVMLLRLLFGVAAEE